MKIFKLYFKSTNFDEMSVETIENKNEHFFLIYLLACFQ